MGDKADDADSVTASAADHSFVRLSTFFFLIAILSLVLSPLFSLSLPPRVWL